ncbi:unnamed protein product, partial [Sphagnum troendelagicum]
MIQAQTCMHMHTLVHTDTKVAVAGQQIVKQRKLDNNISVVADKLHNKNAALKVVTVPWESVTCISRVLKTGGMKAAAAIELSQKSASLLPKD